MTARPYEAHFLIGSARSGTTWLSTALDAHPEIFCTESRLFGRFFDTVHDGAGATARLRITMQTYRDSLATCFNTSGLGEGAPDALLGALSRSLFELAHERTGARIIVEKVTPYVGTAADVVRGINAHYPEARVLHLVRDPRDVLVSGVMHWLGRWSGDAPDETAQRRARWLLEGDDSAAMARLCTDAEVQEWTRAWLEPLVIMDWLRTAHDVRRLTYEQMLIDQAGALRRILEFFGAAPGGQALAACLEASGFERMSGGRKQGESAPGAHVRTGVSGGWRGWLTRRDGHLLRSVAGERLAQQGYETDGAWINDLPERLSANAAVAR